MGYSTDFHGSLKIEPALTPEQVAYLQAFAATRRMARHGYLTEKRPDPVRKAVGLPVGMYGQFFVGEEGFGGQGKGDNSDNIPDLADYNVPPRDQPGLWCQWTVNNEGTELGWDGGEKFYDYVDWLRYLIAHFYQPWGRKLSGEIIWEGEERSDLGTIVVKDNKITVKQGTVSYG